MIIESTLLQYSGFNHFSTLLENDFLLSVLLSNLQTHLLFHDKGNQKGISTNSSKPAQAQLFMFSLLFPVDVLSMWSYDAIPSRIELSLAHLLSGLFKNVTPSISLFLAQSFPYPMNVISSLSHECYFFHVKKKNLFPLY